MQQSYVYNDDLNHKEALKEQLNDVFKACMHMVSSVLPTQPGRLTPPPSKLPWKSYMSFWASTERMRRGST